VACRVDRCPRRVSDRSDLRYDLSAELRVCHNAKTLGRRSELCNRCFLALL
jgi:hypothetical protein